jgi:stage III sporulation protein AG
VKKLFDFLGLGGKETNSNKFPSKDLFRRNLWLAGLAALGIIMLLFSSTGRVKPAEKTPVRTELPAANSLEQTGNSMSAQEEKISIKLCEMLRQVEGAGKVEVSVRLSGSTREEYAVNTTTGKKTTQERDQTGGTRVTTEDTSSGQLVMNRSGSGSEQPVVERETAPQVAGVLVVAEGASEAKVKAKLFEATRVSLGIEPQKIMVLPMERR